MTNSMAERLARVETLLLAAEGRSSLSPPFSARGTRVDDSLATAARTEPDQTPTQHVQPLSPIFSRRESCAHQASEAPPASHPDTEVQPIVGVDCFSENGATSRCETSANSLPGTRNPPASPSSYSNAYQPRVRDRRASSNTTDLPTPSRMATTEVGGSMPALSDGAIASEMTTHPSEVTSVYSGELVSTLYRNTRGGTAQAYSIIV